MLIFQSYTIRCLFLETLNFLSFKILVIKNSPSEEETPIPLKRKLELLLN